MRVCEVEGNRVMVEAVEPEVVAAEPADESEADAGDAAEAAEK